MRVTPSFCRSHVLALSATLVFLGLGGPACGQDKPTTSAKTPAAKAQDAAPATPTAAPDSARRTADTAAAKAMQEPPKKQKVHVDVYLFHGTYRCYSCNLMEQLTVEAIDEQLAAEKKDGRVVFAHVNVDEASNQHYIDDYRLAAISIILSQKVDGAQKQWKNLEQVWTLLRQPEQFKSYVIKEIKAYLGS